MIVSLFSQFQTPILVTIPLSAIALIIPWILYPTPLNRWQNTRILGTLSSLFVKLTAQIVKPIPPKGRIWALMLLSLLVMLITLNGLGMLPYAFTVTTQAAVTLGLAFPLWLAAVITGFRRHPLRSISHIVPPSTPWYMVPFLIIIETISILIRPVALGVRLAANLTAGHVIIYMCAKGVASMVSKMLVISPPFAYMAVTLPLLLGFYALLLLELVVAMIQAYVFVLLLSLYLQENT